MGGREGVIYRSHTLMLSQHATEHRFTTSHNRLVRIGHSTIKVETPQPTTLQYTKRLIANKTRDSAQPTTNGHRRTHITAHEASTPQHIPRPIWFEMNIKHTAKKHGR